MGPDIDERLIMPGTRYEVIDGEVVHVSPADPPHAAMHSRLSALLQAYRADGYTAASDMLTRTSEKNDVAPDGSIYPSAPDPITGGRQLEHLAFEVVSTQSLSNAAKKAATLAQRGVRRVFGLDVERKRVLEWSSATAAWEILAVDAVIEDPVLVLGLPVSALVQASETDDAIARALLAKNNALLATVVEAASTEAEAKGKAEGEAKAVVAVLDGRGIDVDPEQREHITSMRDPTVLARWLARAGTCTTTDELLESD